jgi:hypothetical protein
LSLRIPESTPTLATQTGRIQAAVLDKHGFGPLLVPPQPHPIMPLLRVTIRGGYRHSFFHQTLKGAILCHADQRWTEELSLVLLGIPTALKADLQASVAELVCMRRATCSDSGPNGARTSHRPAPPAYGPPQTISGSTQYPSWTSWHSAPIWSPLRAAPTRSCRRERKRCNSLMRDMSVNTLIDKVKPAYILTRSQVKVKSIIRLTVSRPVYLGFRQPSKACDQSYLLIFNYLYSCWFVDMEHPLWQEDWSVVYSCGWASPARPLSDPSFAGLMTMFCCLKFETPRTWKARFLYIFPPGTR